MASILGIAGTILVLIGLGLPLFQPAGGSLSSILLGLGTLCLLGYFAFHFRSLTALARTRSTRLGAHSLFSVLLAGVVVALLNFLAAKHAPEWDFSETQNFTLSRQTYQVLRTLPREVKMTAFTHEGSPGYGGYQDLLTTYAKESPLITLTFIDPERQPDKAKEYQVTRIDTVVVESGPQKVYLQRSSEADMTNALLRVTQDKKKRIAFVTGHGEKSLTDTESSGLSRAGDALTKQGYEVGTVDWQDTASHEAAVLIVASSTEAVSVEHQHRIRQFLEKGGRVLVMVDPASGDSLDPLITPWGIQLGAGILADEQDRLGRGSPTALLVRTFTTHDITEDFTTPILFPVSRSVTFDTAQGKTWEYVALAQTSPESWEETDLNSPQPEFTAGQDPKGPFTVAGLLIPKPVDQSPTAQSAILIVGNAAFATNGYLTYPGNTDFFLKAIAWLAQEDALVSLTPKDPAFHPFIPNPSQEQALVFFQVLFLPLLTLFIGLSVWKRRRSL
ncbi:Gldg family protein [Nitrospira sp. MA-1]|nr:Gldg family protein [Nitrospira sp. MA-1]